MQQASVVTAHLSLGSVGQLKGCSGAKQRGVVDVFTARVVPLLCTAGQRDGKTPAEAAAEKCCYCRLSQESVWQRNIMAAAAAAATGKCRFDSLAGSSPVGVVDAYDVV